MHTPGRAFALFLLIAFAISWACFLAPLAVGEASSQPRAIAMLVGFSMGMWGPGIAAIVVTLLVLREPIETLGIAQFGGRGAWPYYLAAWLAPPALALVTGVLTWLLQLGAFDPTFGVIATALQRQGIDSPVLVYTLVLFQLGLAFTIGPLLNVAFAAGEEIGWRGFLLPRLEPLGRWKAIGISGVIWGLWHAPAIAQGHNHPGQPVLGIGMMVVFCLLLSVFFSWLYFSTRSAWAPALGHGSLNAWGSAPLLFLTGVNVNIAGTIASPVVWIPLAALALWLWLSGRIARANPPTPQPPVPQQIEQPAAA